MKQNKEIQTQRDNTGVASLVSKEIDIDSIPTPRRHKIQIIDSSGKNVVSAYRKSNNARS